MANFTLDDIRKGAEDKYASFDIELEDRTVRLVNPLRMTKAERKKLSELMESIQESEDQEAAIDDLIVQVADTKENGKALLKALGDDLAQKMYVIESYSKDTQAGEA